MGDEVRTQIISFKALRLRAFQRQFWGRGRGGQLTGACCWLFGVEMKSQGGWNYPLAGQIASGWGHRSGVIGSGGVIRSRWSHVCQTCKETWKTILRGQCPILVLFCRKNWGSCVSYNLRNNVRILARLTLLSPQPGDLFLALQKLLRFGKGCYHLNCSLKVF